MNLIQRDVPLGPVLFSFYSQRSRSIRPRFAGKSVSIIIITSMPTFLYQDNATNILLTDCELVSRPTNELASSFPRKSLKRTAALRRGLAGRGGKNDC